MAGADGVDLYVHGRSLRARIPEILMNLGAVGGGTAAAVTVAAVWPSSEHNGIGPIWAAALGSVAGVLAAPMTLANRDTKPTGRFSEELSQIRRQRIPVGDGTQSDHPDQVGSTNYDNHGVVDAVVAFEAKLLKSQELEFSSVQLAAQFDAERGDLERRRGRYEQLASITLVVTLGFAVGIVSRLDNSGGLKEVLATDVPKLLIAIPIGLYSRQLFARARVLRDEAHQSARIAVRLRSLLTFPEPVDDDDLQSDLLVRFADQVFIDTLRAGDSGRVTKQSNHGGHDEPLATSDAT